MDTLRTVLAAALLFVSTAHAQALRTQVDRAHDRAWTLTRDDVVVRAASGRKIVARLALEGWIWAGEPWSCAPDLALGPRGEAVVTSDVLPVLWRIDPQTLAVTRHELALDADQGRDVGFSEIAWSPRHAAYFAVSAQGSRWRIDARLMRAEKIATTSPARDQQEELLRAPCAGILRADSR